MSAVVVHFRGRAPLRRCLDALLAGRGVTEVLVVDNEGVGSAIRSEHPDPRVRVIQMTRNAGYGRAANAGLESVRAEAALVLNQDVVVRPQDLDRMLEAAAEAGAWVVGPRLLDPGGSPAGAKERFPPPLTWTPPPGDGEGWRYVPWVPGAAMLLPPGHTDLRFDERLFMYAEDEELCWRVWSAGGSVVLAEGAAVAHEGGTATSSRWGRPAITARTVANRARMVRWHRGWAGMMRYLTTALGARLGRKRARRNSSV
jgi:N-acetylglucosaminyl-diphospho-decaprenol L-rhamnosyltransferase